MGAPTFAFPSSTVSTKPGLLAVPNRGLKTSRQLGPHAGVAALAVPDAALKMPVAAPSTTTEANAFRTVDMVIPFEGAVRVLGWSDDGVSKRVFR
jgi:hypothetical protein